MFAEHVTHRAVREFGHTSRTAAHNPSSVPDCHDGSRLAPALQVAEYRLPALGALAVPKRCEIDVH
jgi:hypothetical protein